MGLGIMVSIYIRKSIINHGNDIAEFIHAEYGDYDFRLAVAVFL